MCVHMALVDEELMHVYASTWIFSWKYGLYSRRFASCSALNRSVKHGLHRTVVSGWVCECDQL